MTWEPYEVWPPCSPADPDTKGGEYDPWWVERQTSPLFVALYELVQRHCLPVAWYVTAYACGRWCDIDVFDDSALVAQFDGTVPVKYQNDLDRLISCYGSNGNRGGAAHAEDPAGACFEHVAYYASRDHWHYVRHVPILTPEETWQVTGWADAIVDLPAILTEKEAAYEEARMLQSGGQEVLFQ